MSAAAFLAAALADGLSLTPADDGTLAVRGPDEARARHLPAIKASKADLLRLLTEPRRAWDVTEPTGAAWRSCYAPPQTWAEVLSRYQAGTVAVPVEDPDQGAPLPPDVEAAVRAWLDALGEDCPRTCREVLDRARDVPEARADYLSRARPPAPPGPNHEAPGPSARNTGDPAS